MKLSRSLISSLRARARVTCTKRTSATRRGFTLIELMIAITITVIVTASLLVAFRTGAQAYDMGITHTDNQQIGRFAVTKLAEDLRNVYYKPENQYNVTRRQREMMIQQREQQMLQSGSQNAQDQANDENLPELGPSIDLAFYGDDGGETDQVSFVRLQGPKIGSDRQLWGLERIRYFIADGALYRSSEDVTAPEVDSEGVEIPKTTVPRVDKLAAFCKALDVKYGYYFEKDYQIAENWDSNASQYRNPPSEEDEEALEATNPNSGAGAAGGAVGAQVLTAQQQAQKLKADELPGWVEVTFKFGDPTDEEKVRLYKQTMLLYNKFSQETYEPEDETQQGLGGSSSRGGRSESREDRSSRRSGGRSR